MGRIYKQTKRHEGTPLAVHIGVQLLQLRQRDGVTMREVSAGTGLSSAFICRLENGQSSPSADTLWMLAEYFRVPIEHFFQGYKSAIPKEPTP